MPRYVVSVVRHETSHKVADIEVEARNRREAKRQTVDKVANANWKEHHEYPTDIHYTVEWIQGVKEQPPPTPTTPPAPEKKEGS